jgi:hypothetical protein
MSFLSRSNNNAVAEFNITGNLGALGDGVYFYISWSNSIFHNFFANNTIHVYDAVWDCADPFLILPSINIWDDGYPSGGNYWSGYGGVDLYKGPYQNVSGSDGIGDVPYDIDIDNADHYPFMAPSWPTHDVAVANVLPSKSALGQGYLMNVSVLLANYGTYNETCSLTVYVNSSVLAHTTTNMTAKQSVEMIFSWNSTGFGYGNYTLWACVDAVQGEMNTDNNNCTAGLTAVTIPGDVDGNFKVNMGDVVQLCTTFGATPGKPRWNPNCDIDNNAKIDMGDIIIALKNFGKTYP